MQNFKESDHCMVLVWLHPTLREEVIWELMDREQVFVSSVIPYMGTLLEPIRLVTTSL